MIQTVSRSTTRSSAVAPIELSLSVELAPGSEGGLLRALTVLHRRRCRVLEARYESGTAAGEGVELREGVAAGGGAGAGAGAERLTLRIQAPSRHAHCVEAWLSSLVDVRAVAAGVSA